MRNTSPAIATDKMLPAPKKVPLDQYFRMCSPPGSAASRQAFFTLALDKSWRNHLRMSPLTVALGGTRGAVEAGLVGDA
jgi:hypothetical protein